MRGILWYDASSDRLTVAGEEVHAGDLLWVSGHWLRVEYWPEGWVTLDEDNKPVWIPLGIDVELRQR